MDSKTENNSQELFYNVMPEDSNSGPLVNSEVTSTTKYQTPVTSGPGFLERFKPFIIGGVGIIIIGVAAFFLYKYFSQPDETPVVVQNQTNTTEPTKEETTPPPYTTPAEWQTKFFGSETCLQLSICGDEADVDRDGLSNLEEFNSTTDPNNSDSDSDGLADGDEAHVFGSNPLKIRTAEDPKYTDSDYAKGGYDATTKQKFTSEKLVEVKTKIKQYGFHSPTLATLLEFANITYGFGSEDGQSSNSGLDNTPQGKLDRDEIRLTTIKKIGVALIKYKAAVGSFPQSTNFSDMVEKVKPYNPVATNAVDPINKDQYTYTYQAASNSQDFTLTYYSETLNQIIKYKAVDAQKNTGLEQASLNNDQRIRDLENMRTALLIYSSATVAGTQDYVFPPVDSYKTALVPKYLSTIPKDPKTGQDYVYTVSSNFNTFSLKVILENPDPGTTGYLCNQEECRNY